MAISEKKRNDLAAVLGAKPAAAEKAAVAPKAAVAAEKPAAPAKAAPAKAKTYKVDTLYSVDPVEVVIVGLDTQDGVEHPLYDERIHLPILDTFKANISALGVSVPVICRAIAGKLIAVDGRQRIRALREINAIQTAQGEPALSLPVRVIAVDDNVSVATAISLNTHRFAENVMDLAEKAMRNHNRGISKADLSNSLGVSEQQLNRLIRLAANGTPDLKNAVRTGLIVPTAAYGLAAKSAEVQNAAVQAAKSGKKIKAPVEEIEGEDEETAGTEGTEGTDGTEATEGTDEGDGEASDGEATEGTESEGEQKPGKGRKVGAKGRVEGGKNSGVKHGVLKKMLTRAKTATEKLATEHPQYKAVIDWFANGTPLPKDHPLRAWEKAATKEAGKKNKPGRPKGGGKDPLIVEAAEGEGKGKGKGKKDKATVESEADLLAVVGQTAAVAVKAEEAGGSDEDELEAAIRTSEAEEAEDNDEGDEDIEDSEEDSDDSDSEYEEEEDEDEEDEDSN
jgi:hypothetical protein